MNNRVAAPVQNIKVRADIRRIEQNDTVQYKPFNGGEPRMLKVSSIHSHKTDVDQPRLFIGMKNGAEVRVFEHQIIRVIFMSKDEYEDLQIPA